MRACWHCVLCLMTCALSAAAATFPDGFSTRVVATGFSGATALEVAPDGRIFVCEQTGTLRVMKDGRLLPEPFVRLTVDSSWERGLLGIALDPAFPRRPYVYVNYIAPKPYPHHRISRFTARGDQAVPGSERILFEGDNQEKMGGGVKNGHQGGAIHFGKDGKLYIAIGDQTAGAPAQDMNTLLGKILRINPDGSIPHDNPFYQRTPGKYRAIWCLGCRNPFAFAVQPRTGRMFIGDVGGANEEINVGVAGANFGWPIADHGPTRDPRFRGPIYWYPESSITGGTFYNPPHLQFPREYVGRYFFPDFKQGWIKTLDPDHPADVRLFAMGLGQWSVVDMKVAPDGTLYYLSRQAWVRDKDFKPHTGILVQVRYTGGNTPPMIAADLVDHIVLAEGPAHFAISATGTGPLYYQWQRNGVNITGATQPTYTLPVATAKDSSHSFRCIVRNRWGQAASRAALLTVRARHQGTAAVPGLAVLPDPGTYTGSILVRLEASTPGAVIRYTTDGQEPTPAARLYREPFSLSHSATVKARIFNNASGQTLVARYDIQGHQPYGLPTRPLNATFRVPLTPNNAPRHLSETGLFTSVRDLKPAPGLVPYEVNAPLWSDGAGKQRWIALPAGGRIDFAPTGEWTFPPGTILVKHFELPPDETQPGRAHRLETRLLVVDETGNGYGVTYKWRPDNSDADLLAGSLNEALTIRTAKGKRDQTWYYPSQADCLVCHNQAARFVLGVKTRQLNRSVHYADTERADNQLRVWNYLGMFTRPVPESDLGRLPRLVDLYDQRASLVVRARSYLDANCAHCHRPGNPLRATFDARFDTPLVQQGIVDAPTVSDSLSILNPRVVASGAVGRSMIYQRLHRADSFRMPPLATRVNNEAALRVLHAWIESLAPRRVNSPASK